jgi:hypothetical protein
MKVHEVTVASASQLGRLMAVRHPSNKVSEMKRVLFHELIEFGQPGIEELANVKRKVANID